MRKIILATVALATIASPALAESCTAPDVAGTWSMTTTQNPSESCTLVMSDKGTFTGKCKPQTQPTAYTITGTWKIDAYCRLTGTVPNTKGAFSGRIDDNGGLWLGTYTAPVGKVSTFMAYKN